MSDAYGLFNANACGENRMKRKSRAAEVVMWNVMVDGYIRLGDFKAAKEMFDNMPCLCLGTR